jgi:SAM-dependent methyltransferase
VKKVLNVGGNDRSLIALPAEYAGFEHILLDIDPSVSPDILCDARELLTLDAGQFDAVHCSHNLEHYHRHDVPKVLAGFMHVLKDGGIAQIRVPDIAEVMRIAVERKLDIEDPIYQSTIGPISVHDVIYGHGREIERSGQDFYAHKTGFTPRLLSKFIHQAGFSRMYSMVGNLEIHALVFKGLPDPSLRAIFNLPPDPVK